MRMLERFQQEQQQSTVSRYRAVALENVPDQQHGTAHSLTDVPRLQQALEAEGGWWSPKRTQQGAGAVQRAPTKMTSTTTNESTQKRAKGIVHLGEYM